MKVKRKRDTSGDRPGIRKRPAMLNVYGDYAISGRERIG